MDLNQALLQNLLGQMAQFEKQLAANTQALAQLKQFAQATVQQIETLKTRVGQVQEMATDAQRKQGRKR